VSTILKALRHPDAARTLLAIETYNATAIDKVSNHYARVLAEHLKIAQTALMMVGLCHDRLGQRDEAIAIFEKAVSEYADLKGWIDATYFYLGRDYQDQGQTAKARAAFENCLKAGEGVRDPNQFPLKDAREAIAQIKSQ